MVPPEWLVRDGVEPKATSVGGPRFWAKKTEGKAPPVSRAHTTLRSTAGGADEMRGRTSADALWLRLIGLPKTPPGLLT